MMILMINDYDYIKEQNNCNDNHFMILYVWCHDDGNISEQDYYDSDNLSTMVPIIMIWLVSCRILPVRKPRPVRQRKSKFCDDDDDDDDDDDCIRSDMLSSR